MTDIMQNILLLDIENQPKKIRELRTLLKQYDGEFKHEVRQFQKPYDNQ